MEFLDALKSGWHVDQAILSEEEHLVVIRFGKTGGRVCLEMDEILARVAPSVANFAVIYTCDTQTVPDFNEMYELWGDVHTMIFFGNKHIMVDTGSGQNNNIDFVVRDTADVEIILELAFRAAKRGIGLANSHRDFSKERANQIKYGF